MYWHVDGLHGPDHPRQDGPPGYNVWLGTGIEDEPCLVMDNGEGCNFDLNLTQLRALLAIAEEHLGDNKMGDESEHPGEVAYHLIYPLVVVKSNGGALDDKAFVCGLEYGWLENCLVTLRHLRVLAYRTYIRDLMKDQVDLLAMHLRWKVEYVGWMEDADGVEGWTMATFEAQPLPEGE